MRNKNRLGGLKMFKCKKCEHDMLTPTEKFVWLLDNGYLGDVSIGGTISIYVNEEDVEFSKHNYGGDFDEAINAAYQFVKQQSDA